ncbi:MAG TPA: MFS transporter [Planctomycetota bacterium]|nr:MFS transporter [Planctomycetota bacterium]HRR81689.1 MFS transporter [Planctomycetota bacterium]
MSSWKRTFHAAFAAQVCSILGFSLAMPFMPFYIRQLGITQEAAVACWSGVVNGAAGFTMALFGPLWGMVADRVGRRPMVLRSMYGGVLVLLLMAIAQNVYQLLAFRLLQGALTGTIAALVALVASEAPRERAGYALGVMQSAVFVGFSAGPLIGGPLADALGYRVMFALSSLLLLAGGLLVQFGVRERFAAASGSSRPERDGFRAVLAAQGFIAAVLVLLSLRYANSISAPTFALFVEQMYGQGRLTNTVVGALNAVGGFSAAVGAFLLGNLSDRWGHKRLLVASCVFGSLVSLGYVFVGGVWQLGALRLLFGLGAAGILPAANAIIRHITEDHNMGRAYGLTTSANSLGWMLGSLSGGEVAAIYGLRAPFVLMAIGIGLAGLLVVCFVRKDPPRKPGAPGGEPIAAS